MHVAGKVDKGYTYSANANYWAPLSNYDDDDDDDSNEEIKKGEKTSTMILDSGATSHFVNPKENLPITGKAHKTVALPDGSTISATHTAELPFSKLTNDARKAYVLPGLQPNSLVSVGKLADAEYTTIFHPARKGVTVNQKGSIQIKLLHKPVLQGGRDNNGLWQLSQQTTAPSLVSKMTKQEVASNVYNLLSMS